MSDGILARPRQPLDRRADFSAILAGSWTGLAASDLARRQVLMEGGESVSLGELFDLSGSAGGRIRFEGDLQRADRIAAGLSEGEVVVDGRVGAETGLGMSGGSVDVRGDAGARTGGAADESRRGMTGGQILVRGDAGPEPGLRMRRGLIVVTGAVARHAGPYMIAGSIVVFGETGPAPGLRSKRGSVVGLVKVEIPPTYRYACTYRPDHLRLTLLYLRKRYDLAVDERYIEGAYRRYSGDLADLGRGEILEWTAE